MRRHFGERTIAGMCAMFDVQPFETWIRHLTYALTSHTCAAHNVIYKHHQTFDGGPVELCRPLNVFGQAIHEHASNT